MKPLKQLEEIPLSEMELDFLKRYKVKERKSYFLEFCRFFLGYLAIGFVFAILFSNFDDYNSPITLSVIVFFGILFFVSDRKYWGVNKDLVEKLKIRQRGIIQESGNEGLKRWFKLKGNKPNLFVYESVSAKMIYDFQEIEFEYYKNSAIVIKVYI